MTVIAPPGLSSLPRISNARTGCVMELGLIRLRGQGQALLDDPEVKRLYLGSEATSKTPQ